MTGQHGKVLAVIPGRGGSKRVPGKNWRDFAGVPLIAWSIRFAKAYEGFDTVIVSTDDERIAMVAADEGLPVPFMRPSELALDRSTSADVVRHAITHEAAQGRTYRFVAVLQPTSPIRERRRWDEAFSLLVDPAVNAAVGVRPAQDHPYHTYTMDRHDRLEAFVSGSNELRELRSQDLPPAFTIAGNLYLVRTSAFCASGTLFPEGTAGVVCDEPCEALDIDTEDDWIMGEILTKRFGKKSWPRS